MKQADHGGREAKTIVVSLSDGTFREAEQLAAEQGVSIAQLIGHLIEEQAHRSHRYEQAMRQQLSLIRDGSGFRLGGKIGWDRSELHER
ncbi:MAG: hypothetical protein ACYDAG_01830 [Chloroflexota bacterium]